MAQIKTTAKRLLRRKDGNIAISAALTAPLLIVALALGVDYGYLTLQQRTLQQSADLAAIVASASIDDAEQSVLNYFVLNSQKLNVKTDTGLLTPNGKIPFDPNIALANYDGYATVTKGRYTGDSSVAVDKRFAAGVQPYDAVKVAITEKGQIFFAGTFTTAPTMSAVGTAAANKVAAFSIGSRLASLDGGLLNGILGGLLGTTVSLSLMDYQSLLATDIDALAFADALALNLGLTAGTYGDLLKTDITYGQFLNALGKTTGITPAVATILKNLEKSLSKTQVTLNLGELLNLAPMSQRIIGTGNHLAVKASVFELVSAAATAANGGSQISVNLGATIPGLAATTLTIAVGQPPVGTPPLAIGSVGTIVRTAQTRVGLQVSVNGLAAIAGLKINVPVYVDVANAEAKLTDIQCFGRTPNNANVLIDAVPGIAEIALGTVDQAAFVNFGTTPRVTKATLIDSLLLKVSATAQIDINNLTKTKLTFSPSDIAAGKIKTVSTKDALTSLVASLLGNLSLDINLLGLTLGTGPLVQGAIIQTLSGITAPLDTVLYNTLLMLGVKIGEADVRVTGVSCQQPVLVQ
jgi:uncharacterized membrane protein